MGMDSGPRGLPGVRSLGNGTGTAEEQPAPPPARAAEPDLGAVGVSEVTQRTSGPIGGASDLFSGIPAEGMEAKTLGTVTPRKPVLSVSARKIKDNAADWHNLILKWETLNDGGFATANSIANMKISLSSKDKIELASSGLASDDCAEKEHPEYSRELETLCEELQATLEGLREWFPRLDLALNLALVEGGGVHVPQLDEHFTTKIQMKMEKLSSTTKGVCELEDYHHGEERKCPPLFHTWPTAHFYEVSRKLSDMYGQELRLKRTVVEQLAHTADRDLALSYLSMWLHQPYLEAGSRLLLESMLLETGHRAL